MSLRAKQGIEQMNRPAAQKYEDDCRLVGFFSFFLQQSPTARLLAFFLRVGYVNKNSCDFY